MSYSTDFVQNGKKTFIIVCFLKMVLFNLVKGQCSGYFNYYLNTTSEEIMGLIKLPNPPQNLPLRLTAVFRVDTLVQNNKKGKVFLANSTEEFFHAVQKKMPLYYKVFFPIQAPIPIVTMIMLNDHYYCVEHDYPAANVHYRTRITLQNNIEKRIFPIKKQSLEFKIPVLSTTTTATTIKRDVRTTTTVPNNYEEITDKLADSSCGLTNPSIDDRRLSLPWIAAIFFMVIENKSEFQCTGTILSRQHVLTVARCLKTKNGENVSRGIIFVSFGRYDISNWDELGSETYDVLEYTVHPEFKGCESADSDLAIIKISEPLSYTLKIRPLCLWMGKIELNYVLGKSAYVVGWENTNKKSSSTPRISKVSIVSRETCLNNNERYTELMSVRTFCAKNEMQLKSKLRVENCDGFSGPGSALVMLEPSSGRYHLRGLVSTSLNNSEKRFCSFEDCTVYVDAAKYLKWIREQIIL